ncbi:hypothetical protein YYU_01730 [Anaplasma phagocytophilum str. HZ2]|uniref:Uncharacterized protein n=1 Tax=Anaplasma phagocytophilum (strain HZ) TaxID=212042 RepID=Q2GKY3_ANAPZ|nr:hypothetical protein APH_0361 [Anaplasma phagocytophilum str. HZ]AGR79279.1 hypothetical protein YYU_01730 [Anaplasma phagocytophilum str. HZ2]
MVSVFQHLCCVSSIVLPPVAAYGFQFRYCCGVLCVEEGYGSELLVSIGI